MPDSYDMLARSIERVIRSDLPPPASPQQLASSIDRIMIDESRAGSLRLAYLRLVVVAGFAVMSIDALVRGDAGDPSAPAGAGVTLTAALALAWLAVAVALALALRKGWYRRWVPHVMPGIDAAMIAAGFLAPLLLAGEARREAEPEAIASLIALCAYLGISGGLRLSRSSARAGMVLSVVVFVTAAFVARLSPVPTTAVAATLVAAGVVSASITQIIRRLVTDEVAKATLSQMYEEAALAIDAREQVLKIVVHDLRNPLHTIAMGADLLIEAELPPERQREHLRRIKRAGERMDRLVQDLLDVAKLEAGRVAIVPRDVDVPKMLREAHGMLAPLAAERSIELALDAPESLPRVSADEGRIIQVLSNIVGNALKFTPVGGRVVIAARPAPGGVHFSVSDTGPGIPADKLDRIFGRFWQADAADRRGIGLGLTIAKGIMDAHAGRLWVESRVGEGTTFHFVLGTASPSSGSRTSRSAGRMELHG